MDIYKPKRGLEPTLPSQASEGIKPTGTLISGFQPPEVRLEANTHFVVLWVIEALANEQRFWYQKIGCCYSKCLKMWKWLGIGSRWQSFEAFDRESPDSLRQLGRNTNVKGTFGKVLG